MIRKGTKVRDQLDPQRNLAKDQLETPGTGAQEVKPEDLSGPALLRKYWVSR